MQTAAIIGFGCAGYHGAKAMREAGFDGTIDVYSDGALPPCNPMLTTYHAGGRLAYEGMFPFGGWERVGGDYALRVRRNEPVTRLYAAERKLVTPAGEQSYDKILIASGARAFVPPLAGLPTQEVFCLRTPQDAQRLRARIERGDVRRGVVIGASMAGVKVAELLVKAGARCLLADMAPHVFPLAAMPEIARELQRRIEQKGVQLAFGVGLTGVSRRAQGGVLVHFGERTEQADLVALCIGVRANIDFLDPREIALDRGIVVGEDMRSSVPGIYAAGDCCAARNLQTGGTQPISLWANAGYQGRAAGRAMAGRPAVFEGSFPQNITHFLDMDFIGFGDVGAQGETLDYRRPDGSFRLRAVLRDGRPVCLNLLDNYHISGVIKHYMTKRFLGAGGPVSALQRGVLLRAGMPRAVLERLEDAYENE